jgi:hypothetical protein
MIDKPTDADRIAKLKELASAGLTGLGASYFNHLIDIYDRVRKLTPQERKRVDVFLTSRHK